MLLKRTSYRTPIGLDLGRHSTKAVQLVRRGDRAEAIAAVNLPKQTPGSELTVAELNRLRDVLRRQGFVGDDVIAALQPEMMISSQLELPARAPGLPMDDLARAEFCRVNKAEPGSVVMSYWDLPAPDRARPGTFAMAVGCRDADANGYLDLIESAGMSVTALDASGLALARACQKLPAADQSMTAVLDLGWLAATLSILRSGVVVYQRRIVEAGLGEFIQLLAGEEGATTGDVEYLLRRTRMADDPQGDAEDQGSFDGRYRVRLSAHFAKVSGELKQALGYAAHQYPGSETPHVWLAGGGAENPGLAAFFEEMLGAPVKRAAAADVVQCPPSLAGTMDGAMLAATGLALFDPK